MSQESIPIITFLKNTNMYDETTKKNKIEREEK